MPEIAVICAWTSSGEACSSASKAKSTSRAKSASASKKTTTRRPATPEAIALLKADHREVEKLFSQFEKAKDDDQKLQLAQRICLELKVHTQIEEEIVYPTSREFLDDEDIVDEAVVEHQAAKDLIAEIEGMKPGDDLYDAKVKVLSEQVEHHVEEEEKEYFPKLQKSDMDLKAIGEQLKMRKQELMGQMEAEAPLRTQ